MKSIAKEELERMLRDNEDFQLIDVREAYEYEEQNLGGLNLPLDEVLTSRDKLETGKPVVFCCKSGKRSAAIAMALERKYGMHNLSSLAGGLQSYFE